MAFSIFGKRSTDPEPEKPAAPVSAAQEPAVEPKRGFFDRMKQAVTRTRDSFTESISSVIALTREIDFASLDKLEAVLLAADIGSTTSKQIIENLKQRALRQGIEGGAELRRLLKIELKAVLDGVAVPVNHPAAPPEVIMMVGLFKEPSGRISKRIRTTAPFRQGSPAPRGIFQLLEIVLLVFRA